MKVVEPLEKMVDYKEVEKCKSQVVILGLHKDIHKYKQGPNFIGVIFNPERRKERWSYRKNIAFFTAALDLKKTMIIVSDLDKVFGDESDRMLKNGRKKIIIDELLWLCDNQYTFAKADNIVIAKPSKSTHRPTIVNYRHFSYNYRLGRLKTIMSKLHIGKGVDCCQKIVL